MQQQSEWRTELIVTIKSENELEIVDEFTLLGRAAEVPLPAVGEIIELRSGSGKDPELAKIVNVRNVGHILNRRTTPWIWTVRHEVLARIHVRSPYEQRF